MYSNRTGLYGTATGAIPEAYQLPLRACFLAVSEWRIMVATTLGQASQHLPPDRATITTFLNQAAASCVQQLLSAALPASSKFHPENLLPVLEAAVAACNPAAVAVTLAAGSSRLWKAAVVQEQIEAAAKKGSSSCFKLLVEAAEGAERAAAPQGPAPRDAAAAAGQVGKAEQQAAMVVLKQALKAAVQHKHQQSFIAWVLEKGLQAGGWTADNMAPAVTACILNGRSRQLKQLLVGCCVAWQHSELKDHTMQVAAVRGKHSVALLQQLFAAAAAEAPWTDEDLYAALAEAISYPECTRAVTFLLQKPALGWENTWLVPALERTVEHMYASKPVECGLVLKAAKEPWTAEQLSNTLRLAVRCVDIACMQIILKVKGVHWAAAEIAPAVEAAAIGAAKLEQLQQLLKVPLVSSWTGQQVEVLARITIRGMFHEGLEAVLGLRAAAVELTANQIKSLLSQLLRWHWSSVSQLLQHTYSRAWYELGSFETQFSARSATVRMLLTLPNAAWAAQDLAELLAVAAAAGDKKMITVVLEQQGVQWQLQQLVPAIQAALRAERWELLPMLLAAYQGGPPVAAVDLVPVLLSVCKCGRVEGFKQLQLLLSKASVEFSGQDHLAALAEAVDKNHPELVSCLLSGPFKEAGWAAGELVGLVLVALRKMPCFGAASVKAVQQLLAYPVEGWQGVDFSAPADAAMRDLHWGQLKLMLEVQEAGRGNFFEVKTFLGAFLQNELWVYRVPKLLEIKQWSGEGLWELLKAAVGQKQWEVVRQVVGHVTGGWEAEKMAPVLTAAAASGAAETVVCLLAAPGVEVSAAALDGVLQAAVVGKHWPVVQLLLEVEGAGWTGGRLREALVAIMHPKCVKQLQMLLSVPGVVWEGEVLQAAVDVGVSMRSWSGLDELVSAEKVKWDARGLGQLLLAALKCDRQGLAKKILAKGLVDFSDDEVAAAALAAAATSAAAKRGKTNMLKLLLEGFNGWSAVVLQSGLIAAAKEGNCSAMLRLLGVRGDLGCKQFALQPVTEAAAGSQKWKAVQLLLRLEGVRWQAVQLEQVLVAAAAAGMTGLVREVLRVVEHGWVGEEMASAAAAAVAGKHWRILEELLRVEAAGWAVGDLRGLLVKAVAVGIDDVGMLLEVPGVVWEESEVAEAIGVAERRGDGRVAQQLRAAHTMIAAE